MIRRDAGACGRWPRHASHDQRRIIAAMMLVVRPDGNKLDVMPTAGSPAPRGGPGSISSKSMGAPHSTHVRAQVRTMQRDGPRQACRAESEPGGAGDRLAARLATLPRAYRSAGTTSAFRSCGPPLNTSHRAAAVKRLGRQRSRRASVPTAISGGTPQSKKGVVHAYHHKITPNICVLRLHHRKRRKRCGRAGDAEAVQFFKLSSGG